MTKRILILASILTLLLLTACQPAENITNTPPAHPKDDTPCGDGVCDGPENPSNCPADCAETTRVEYNTNIIYLGVMVHLEGWDDHVDQDKFERHAELVRAYADLFDEYGALLTYESREFTDGCIKWGDNVMLEMEQRGHDVGVHADIGGQQTYDCSNFVSDLRREREQLESLGVSVRHVSGNTSHCDWVTATINAGYEFTTGGVAYSVMSMPEENRPEEFRYCETPSKCHDVFPAALEDRLTPTRALDGTNWLVHNPEGQLVIIHSAGGITNMAEERDGFVPPTTNPYTLEDVDAAIEELEAAIALIDPNVINTYYLSWSIGSPLDEEILAVWLERVQEFVDAGLVVWASLPDMYDAYISWELDN